MHEEIEGPKQGKNGIRTNKLITLGGANLNSQQRKFGRITQTL